MRIPFIAGNWKMNKTVSEAVEFAVQLKEKVKDIKNVEIMIAPPAPALKPVCDAVKESNIAVGVQNFHWEDSGAYTGEISADMILDAGCKSVIIGHSERRQCFGETNETVNKKLKKALEKGLDPIVCVGENLSEREQGNARAVVETQVTQGFKDISKEDAKKVVIAYEPVWAIGTGKTATPEIAQEMHAFIRGLYGKLFGSEHADVLRIQYGGSVKPGNVKELMSQPDLDGALVGGASLDVDSFTALINFQGD